MMHYEGDSSLYPLSPASCVSKLSRVHFYRLNPGFGDMMVDAGFKVAYGDQGVPIYDIHFPYPVCLQ